MVIRLRQVALVAHDLDAVEEDLVVELGLEPCVRDLGVSQFGLRNVLFPVGERLLEGNLNRWRLLEDVYGFKTWGSSLGREI